MIDEDDDDEFQREENGIEEGGLADFVFEEIPDKKAGGIQPDGKRINVMTAKDLNAPVNNATNEEEALEKLAQF